MSDSFFLNSDVIDYNKLLNRYNDISKELATVSDSNSEEEVANINDMFKREMAIFLKLLIYFSSELK
jgi:hypothetical protein